MIRKLFCGYFCGRDPTVLRHLLTSIHNVHIFHLPGEQVFISWFVAVCLFLFEKCYAIIHMFSYGDLICFMN